MTGPSEERPAPRDRDGARALGAHNRGGGDTDSTTWLARYGVEVKKAALANIRFDSADEKSIQDKPIEEQRAEQKLHGALSRGLAEDHTR